MWADLWLELLCAKYLFIENNEVCDSNLFTGIQKPHRSSLGSFFLNTNFEAFVRILEKKRDKFLQISY